MLFDTDVLIWVFRGNLKATKLIEQSEERLLSVISYMEMLQGARDRRELRSIKAFLSEAGIRIVPLSENIGHRAAIYMEELGLGTGMSMADALLAATAVENQLVLCTANQRHYKAISELQIKPLQP